MSCIFITKLSHKIIADGLIVATTLDVWWHFFFALVFLFNQQLNKFLTLKKKCCFLTQKNEMNFFFWLIVKRWWWRFDDIEKWILSTNDNTITHTHRHTTQVIKKNDEFFWLFINDKLTMMMIEKIDSNVTHELRISDLYLLMICKLVFCARKFQTITFCRMSEWISVRKNFLFFSSSKPQRKSNVRACVW